MRSLVVRIVLGFIASKKAKFDFVEGASDNITKAFDRC